MDSLGLFGSLIGHVGDGNFHESILYDNRDPKQREAVEKCVHDMVDRAIEMDGTCTVSYYAIIFMCLADADIFLGRAFYWARKEGIPSQRA